MEYLNKISQHYIFPQIQPLKESYLYFPLGIKKRNKLFFILKQTLENEQYKHEKKDKVNRYFFDGQIQFTNFEYEKLQIFGKYLEEKKHDCCFNSSFWSDSMKLRFLAANNYEKGNTVKSIIAYNEWMNSHFNLEVDQKMQSFLQEGIIYLSGKDHRYRPIIILNVFKLVGKENSFPDILKAITYFLDVIMENMFLPGQIENWVIICDLNNLGITNLPMNSFKKIIQYLMNNYKSRLHRLYVVNCAGLISIPWAMIKPLLDENTIEKVSIEKTNELKNLWNHVNKNQIEKRFSGNLENITNFWYQCVYQYFLMFFIFIQASAQRLHLRHVAYIKPSIDNRKPWSPHYSLSKWANKYTIQTNLKIQQENKALLNKMMFIDKKSSIFNSQKLLESHHYIKSMADYYRGRQQKELHNQNNKIMHRLQSAQKNSIYGKKMWVPEIKKIELYRSNIIKSRSKGGKEIKGNEIENQYGRKQNNEIEFEL
ncbi:cral trio domain protein [Ichthyophthirius multifiliis]|uniref:Cral trio domain protein n=1 Tax=Ichthyophthirius multifiliis TaxID=5932 RepID=G0QUT9_ICHMU|nr:cral trio domain protein [Ichthyophthirius multifiliis]EGR31019.1 cral trio domain protein [Ichthyophthirius multifiliis]|eukprot:XP_004034505.1 cral trio domain protein [Ichthyophthirius multifiliis]